tara:strand:+ start:35132 stop:35242 length:111 start_codon:yes stop_codon:yes gene_type:complete
MASAVVNSAIIKQNALMDYFLILKNNNTVPIKAVGN